MAAMALGLVFGGRSPEHDVSLLSAKRIYGALLELGCEVHCIGIDRSGIWRYHNVSDSFPKAVDGSAPVVSMRLGYPIIFYEDARSGEVCEVKLDLLFPALHGPWGEDGTIQGLAAMSNLRCVGSSTLGSAIAMDKDITKRLLRAEGIAITPYIACEQRMPPWHEVVAKLGGSIYVKPASQGSSIGVQRIVNADEYELAFAEAANLDAKVLLETEIRGREIECGILQVDGKFIASEPGEIIPLGPHIYYDYVAKYADKNGARLCIPAVLSEKTKMTIQELSKRAFKCLGLSSFARIDFFLTEDEEIILNEANSLPGFTDVSMYPQMFGHSGYSLTCLIEKILDNAVGPARSVFHYGEDV
jgi:D-alanine-D-alanine ligase